MATTSERARLLAAPRVARDDDDDDEARAIGVGVGDEDATRTTARGAGVERRRARGVAVGVLSALAVAALVIGACAPTTSRETRAAALGDASETRAPKLNVPIYVMGDLRAGTEDRAKIDKELGWLRGALAKYSGMSGHEMAQTIFTQQATFPAHWPETKEVTRTVARAYNTSDNKLARIRWISPIGMTPETCKRWCSIPGLGHHVGCLITHMTIWERFLRSKAKSFVVWESDGAGLNSVHPLDYNSLDVNLPDDADLVWMKPYENASGQFVKKFKSVATGRWGEKKRYNDEKSVYLYKFNKRCGGWAGTPSYMMTRRGVEKIKNFILTSESVDMIDAWLSGHCMKRCANPKKCMNLNCYMAQSRPVSRDMLAGFVPGWYEKDDYTTSSTLAVDKRIVERMDWDFEAYNNAACERGAAGYGFAGAWLPISYREEEDEFGSNRRMVIDNSPQATIHDCHVVSEIDAEKCKARLPLREQRARLGSRVDGVTTATANAQLPIGYYEREEMFRRAMME